MSSNGPVGTTAVGSPAPELLGWRVLSGVSKCVDCKKVTQDFSTKKGLFLVPATMPRDMYVPRETKKIQFFYRIEGKRRGEDSYNSRVLPVGISKD